jgi:putative protein-disulfide isomerase
MENTLYYLYDPLCGWCYGAMPALSALLSVGGVRIELLPTGLFAGMGAQVMDDDFAAFAWSNDQRIERTTGQQFTEAYRLGVLADRHQRFDSGPATLALTAVASTDPAKEHEVLKAIQHARYVLGSDVTSVVVLAGLLESLSLNEAAALITHPSDNIVISNDARITHAQIWMHEFGARGVPTLILESGHTRSMLITNTVFSDPHDLVNQIEVAIRD